MATLSLFCHALLAFFIIMASAALYSAAESGNVERVQVLVGRRVDMDHADSMYDRTPLFAASRHGHLTVVRFLVTHGADMEKAGDDGWTPLITASYYGHLGVIRYLLENGANMDQVDVQGRTSLHWAVRNGNLEATKLLMIYGADLNAKTNVGYLPSDFARNEEIKQAIRDELSRRMDDGCWFLRQPQRTNRRRTVQYPYCIVAPPAFAQPQEGEDEDAGEDHDNERNNEEED